MPTPQRSVSIAALERCTLVVFPGMTIFWIGDLTHQGEVSGHNPDDYPPLRAELTDADNKPEVRAEDFMIGPRFTATDAARFVRALVTGVDRPRLYYVIYNRTIYRRATGFKPESYSGGDPHTNHAHVSGHVSDDENGSDWTSVLALRPQEAVADMATAYKIQSTDPKYDGRFYLSNGVNRRGPIRQPKQILGPARAGAVEVTLTDADREAVNMDWETYLDAVAGPKMPIPSTEAEHTHQATTVLGPAKP